MIRLHFTKKYPVIAVIFASIWAVAGILWVHPSDYDRAFIYGQVSRYGQAADLLEARLIANELPPHKLEELAEYYLKANQPHRVEKLIEQHGLPIVYLDRVIQGYEALKKDKSLVRVLLKKKEMFPEDEEVNEKLAQAYFRLGQDDKALAIYQKKTEDKNTAEAWLNMADIYFWKGRVSKGEAALLFAWNLEPSLEITVRIASYYESSRRLKEAEKFLRIAAKKDTTFESQRRLANFYLENRRFAKAIRAIENIPPEWDIHTQLLAVYIYDRSRYRKKLKRLLDNIEISDVPEDEFLSFFYVAFRNKAKPIMDGMFAHIQGALGRVPLAIRVDYAVFNNDPKSISELIEELENQVEKTPENWKQLASLYLQAKRVKDVEALLLAGNLPSQYWDSVVQFYVDRRDSKNIVRVLKTPKAPKKQRYWEQLAFVYIRTKQIGALERLLDKGKLSSKYWDSVVTGYQTLLAKEEVVRVIIQQANRGDELKWKIRLAQFYEASNDLQMAAITRQQIVPLYIPPKYGFLELSRFYMRAQDLEQASVYMQTAQRSYVLSNEENVEALQLYLWNEQPVLALQTLDALPNEALPQESLATYYYTAHAQEDWDRAQRILDYWSQVAPEDNHWELHAHISIQQNKPDEAIAIIEQALETANETQKPKMWEKLYALYEQEQQPSQQLQIAQQLLQHNPQSTRWLPVVMYLWKQEGITQETLGYFETLQTTSPSFQTRYAFIWALMELQQYEAAQQQMVALETDVASQPEKQLKLEQMAIDLGYLSQNQALLQDALEKRYAREQHIEDLVALAYVSSNRSGQEAKYLEYTTELVTRAPSATHQNLWIRALLKNGKTDQATQEMKTLLPQLQSTEDMYQLAALAEAYEQTTLAIQGYEQAVAQNPTHLQAQMGLGRLYFNEKPEKAQKILKQAWKQGHRDIALGEMLYSLNQTAKPSAETRRFHQQLAQHLAKKPDRNASEQRLYVLSLVKAGNYQQALKQPPSSQQANNEALIGALIQEKQPRLALNTLEQWEESFQKNNTYFQLKATAQVQVARRQDALNTLRAWVRQYPDNRDAWVMLAYTYLDVGDRDRAAQAFRQALSLGDD